MWNRNVLLFAMLVAAAAMLAGDGSFRLAAAPAQALRLAETGARTPVDVELVLAVDISYSMDPDEQALQREGYIEALTSPEFLQAMRAGVHARVAVTYVEWAGAADQRIIVPWRVIDGPESADAVAQEIAGAPYRRASRTSISGVLLFAAPLFGEGGFRGLRRVIDVSGDGANNAGPLVALARDEVVAKGITINGLPLLFKRSMTSLMDIDRLDLYYEDCVIGGPGAFVIPIRDRSQFKDAIRTKLVLEVAGRAPVFPEARAMLASREEPRVSCTIGEKLWQERWGN